MAETVPRALVALDALVLNAGAYFGRAARDAEGIEATWALNHLGVFVPRSSGRPAGGVGAGAGGGDLVERRDGGRMRWDDLGRRRYDGMGAYAQSKLANQLFAGARRRLAGTGVSVHAMHPGFVATEFGGDAGWQTPVRSLCPAAFGRTPSRAPTRSPTWRRPGRAGLDGRLLGRSPAAADGADARDAGGASACGRSPKRAGLTGAELAPADGRWRA
jgi:retinol dehydrogenase 12